MKIAKFPVERVEQEIRTSAGRNHRDRIQLEMDENAKTLKNPILTVIALESLMKITLIFPIFWSN